MALGTRKSRAIYLSELQALLPLYETKKEVARVLGITEDDIQHLLNSSDNYLIFREQQKKLLIQEINAKARKVLNHAKMVDPRSAAEAAIVFGTLIDKASKLAGEDKTNTQTWNIGDNRQITIEVSEGAKNLTKRKPV